MSMAPVLGLRAPFRAALQQWRRCQPSLWISAARARNAVVRVCQPGLGEFTGRSASISRFWIPWLFFFFFLTTLQSRSPAPLPAAFELLWNKADTVL